MNPQRYSSENTVLKLFVSSMESLYHNGRVQKYDEIERVLTWKTDYNMISLCSYVATENQTTRGVSLSVQIRDIRLHPIGQEIGLLYEQAQKRVIDF